MQCHATYPNVAGTMYGAKEKKTESLRSPALIQLGFTGTVSIRANIMSLALSRRFNLPESSWISSDGLTAGRLQLLDSIIDLHIPFGRHHRLYIRYSGNLDPIHVYYKLGPKTDTKVR